MADVCGAHLNNIEMNSDECESELRYEFESLQRISSIEFEIIRCE